jgi:hypothetical protein
MSKPSPGFKAKEFSRSAELPGRRLSIEMRNKFSKFLPPQISLPVKQFHSLGTYSYWYSQPREWAKLPSSEKQTDERASPRAATTAARLLI